MQTILYSSTYTILSNIHCNKEYNLLAVYIAAFVRDMKVLVSQHVLASLSSLQLMFIQQLKRTLKERQVPNNSV